MALRPQPKVSQSKSIDNRQVALDLVTSVLNSGAVQLTAKKEQDEDLPSLRARARTDAAFIAQLFHSTLSRLDQLDQEQVR